MRHDDSGPSGVEGAEDEQRVVAANPDQRGNADAVGGAEVVFEFGVVGVAVLGIDDDEIEAGVPDQLDEGGRGHLDDYAVRGIAAGDTRSQEGPCTGHGCPLSFS